jgi:hypothetical protein
LPLVTRAHESGLVLAEEASDEARLSRAIKQVDDRYVLQRHPASVEGGYVYKVYCIVSEDQPALCILTWSDEKGNPLPLSSGLVEEVKKWRPENRDRRGPNEDARNAQIRAETQRLREEQLAAISEDHRPKIERGRVSVSRTRTGKPSWMRNKRPPQSGLGDQ